MPKKGATTMIAPSTPSAVFASLAADKEAGRGNRC
jgi:hypothetical protein